MNMRVPIGVLVAFGPFARAQQQAGEIFGLMSSRGGRSRRSFFGISRP